MKYFIFSSPRYALVRSSTERGAINLYKRNVCDVDAEHIVCEEVSKRYARNEYKLVTGVLNDDLTFHKRNALVLLKQTNMDDYELEE